MKFYLFIVVLISKGIAAQDIIVTDRPDATESALTIPFKTIQFESGITYASEQKVKSYSVPEYLIRLGVNKYLELRLENSYYKLSSINTINSSDLFLGFKAQILNKEKFNIAFLSHVNLPENDRNNLLFIEKLLLSYEINDNTEIGVNLGVDGINGDSNGEFVYAVALGKGVTDKIGFFLENYGSFSESNGLTSVIDGGISYLLKNRIQLDSKVGVDTQFFKDYFVGIGVSVRIIK